MLLPSLRNACTTALALLCLLVAAIATAGPAPDPAGSTRPIRPQAGAVVAIGGALQDNNAAVWGRVVQLAGGNGARIVVLATASADPQRSAAQIVANLDRHGAVTQALPVAPLWPGTDVATAVADPRWVAAVAASQGVFFSGGAQARLLDALQPGGRSTPLLDAIHRLLARGGVVAGTSSGAAVLSEVAFRDAPEVLSVLKGRLREGVEVDRGFGFIRSGVVVDQHFIQRGRIGRLLPLMVARGVEIGLGVEEDSAVVVQGDTVEVIGRRGALVVDLAGARHDATRGAFNVQGARLSWLNSGDRFDLVSRSLRPSQARLGGRLIDAGTPGFKPTHRGAAHFNDMLGDGVVVAAMAQLVDSDQAELLGLAFDARPGADNDEPTLGFEWRLYRSADTRAWAGADGAEPTLSNVLLDVQPVTMARPLHTPFRC